MKSLLYPIIATCALAVPLATFAQSTSPVTREQVRNELIELEQAGYNPATANDYDYPNQLLAAQARVAAKRASGQTSDIPDTDMMSEGASLKGTYDRGHPVNVAEPKNNIFFGQ